MTLQTDIQTLFQKYLTAWNARDFDAVADCYSFPCLFVLPNVSIPVPDAEAMKAMLQQLFTGLEDNGFDRTEIGNVTASACGHSLAIVDASEVKRLRADGTILETIDGHYVARLENGEWRFVSAVTCAPGWRTT